MHFTLLDFVSAVAVATIIGCMARISSARLKATIYMLPIPITIALIATHDKINSDNIIGLLLVCSFIWLTKLLYTKFRTPVLIADISAAILYVAVGYLLIKIIHLNFIAVTVLYILGWGMLVVLFHAHPAKQKVAKPSSISPLIKGAATLFISFTMFSLKDLLAGVVVTFPFSGVFAVVEAKDNLEVFLRVVIRNSLAIVGLFVTMFALQTHLNLFLNLVMGWLVYFIVLSFVQKITV